MDESTGLNLLRALLQAAGGAAVAGGVATSDNWVAISGGIVAVVATIWSHYAHKAVVEKLAALRMKLAGRL